MELLQNIGHVDDKHCIMLSREEKKSDADNLESLVNARVGEILERKSKMC